jgi:very-short-patch-repair endonuclease
VNWEPTEQEVADKLIELAYAWGDIEECLALEAIHEGVDSPEGDLEAAVDEAFRVEATFGRNDFDDPCSLFVLCFDVADVSARRASNVVEESERLRQLILDVAKPWHSSNYLIVRRTRPSSPVEGQLCRRVGEEHPPAQAADLSDVPMPKPTGDDVELVERDGYWLTPIEVPFYDALRDTGLFFAVQPWIQGTDRRYRLDFLVFYDGGAVAVELDGHEYHKSKEQRGYDAERDRWFAARKVQTLRWTGSQVHADPQGCVSELLNVLRAAPAKP